MPAFTVFLQFLVVTHAGSAHERPVDFVLEAMTLDACPQHGDPTSQGYVMPLELECPYDFFPEQRGMRALRMSTYRSLLKLRIGVLIGAAGVVQRMRARRRRRKEGCV